ncbi:MAG: hypothetical protein IIB06_01085 [Bacteroidetes bacterium]|nr:hypothetical protein [Bacteroidota bacterium]
MGLHRILKIVGMLLSVVGAIFLAMIITKGDEVVKATGAGVDGFIYVAYFIFALVLFFVIVFGLKGLFSGNIKNTLIVIGVFITIVLISYILADGTPMELNEGGMLSENGSKWVGAGLYTFYILAFIAIGAMILSGFKKVK